MIPSISFNPPPPKNSALSISEQIKRAAASTDYQGLLAFQGYLINYRPSISPRGRLILKPIENLTFDKPIYFYFLADRILQTIKRIMTESGYRLRFESHFEKNLVGRDILLLLMSKLRDLLSMYKSKVVDLDRQEKGPFFFWKKAIAWGSYFKIRERIKSEPVLPLFFEQHDPILAPLREQMKQPTNAGLLVEENDGWVSVSEPGYTVLEAIEKKNSTAPEKNLSTMPANIMASIRAFLDDDSWLALADVHEKWRKDIKTKKPADSLSVFHFQFKKKITLSQLRQYSPFFTSTDSFSLDVERIAISYDELKSIIDRFPNIKGINFTASRTLSDEHLSLLWKLPHLQNLDLTDTLITDEALKHVGNLPCLEILSLQNCYNITPAGLSHLNKLYYLFDLNLSNIPLKNAELNFLHKMVGLQHLDLSRCELTDTSLCPIKILFYLQTLDLGFNDELTDTGLVPLASLYSLQAIILIRTQITDEGLAAYAQKSKLEILSLNCCRQITDTGISSLICLNSLKSLDLGFCHQVTDASIDPLTQLPALEELNIIRTQISITPRQILARINFRYKEKVTFDDLRKCDPYFSSQAAIRLSLLSRHPYSEIDLRDLVHRFPNITEIDASGTSLTDMAFAELGRLTQVKNLNLSNCERIMYDDDFVISSAPSSTRQNTDSEESPSNSVTTNDGWVDRIEDRKCDEPILSHSFAFWSVNLQTLNLSQCPWISDDDLVHLIGPDLQDVNLEGCVLITDRSLSLLAEKAQPLRLNLRGCSKITTTGAAKLAAMKKLHTLDLSYTQITDWGVSQLTQIATLTKLNLSKTQISNHCLEILINLPALTHLNLSQNQISDEPLDQIIEMVNLRTLDLSSTKITDDGVGFFSLMIQLLELNVSGNSLSKPSLEFLASLSHLKKLTLGAQKI